MNAKLILQDGSIFFGKSFGYEGNTSGELVFNTGMVGYPETLTDPSYAGQILVFTYPLLGNYGIPCFEEEDFFGLKKYFESDKIHLRGIIVSEYAKEYSHFEAQESLQDFLIRHKIPALTGVDTRALTKKLREEGNILAQIIVNEKKKIPNFFDPNEENIIQDISCKEVRIYGKGKKKICLVDMGVKNNIIKSLLTYDTTVIRVPYDYPFMDEGLKFEGLFISNGPGDPRKNTKTIEQIKKAIQAKKSIFGICLGHQLIALSLGAETYKMHHGHRGQNQPCKDLESGKCVISSQNHSFAVDTKTLGRNILPWFENINDASNEGIRVKNENIRSVQFHPESCPGPNDSLYLFKNFIDSL